MLEPVVGDGQVYVPGRGEDKARELRALAEKHGVDWAEVSTTSHGYLVPEALAGDLDDVVRGGDQPAVPTEPGTTTDPKEAWNADAWKEREEGLKGKSVDDAEELLVKPVDEAQAKASVFNPADHSVAEVKEYLESADDAERQRVLDAESEAEKPRKGILKEGDK